MKKIIDCFTFFNELDLLEIRLKYLNDTVDYFVIAEADKTHKGNDKPFILLENMDRFAAFKNKIIYKPAAMKNFGSEKDVDWKREGYQRDCLAMGLRELQLDDNDLILISDLDEIPDTKILQELKKDMPDLLRQTEKKSEKFLVQKLIYYFFKRFRYKLFNRSKYKAQLNLIYFTFIKKYNAPLNFMMLNCAYYLNYIEKKGLWSGLQCVEAKWLKVLTPNEIRTIRNFPVSSLKNSGWHFSYLGGKEIIKHKLKNFAHQEYNIPQIVSDEYIDFCVNNGYSLFEYYKNPGIAPAFEKKQISYLPKDLNEIVAGYENFIIR